MKSIEEIFLSTPSVRRATFCFLPLAITYTQFLSTPSVRRATVHRQRHGRCDDISIHALREEGDVATLLRIAKAQNISIHALREEGDRRLGPDV